MTSQTHTGSCACGGVAFAMTGPLRPVIACHCTQCRKTSGHYWTATSVPHDRFRLIRSDTLRWFRSSDTVERGFCAACGASLFWHPFGEGTRYAAPGDEFDPVIHEALMHRESPDVETTTVEVVAQAGYRMGERVVRVAKVTVLGPE